MNECKNFIPVSTLQDLDALNQDEIVEGYTDFKLGDPEPGSNRGRSYWHGWRNAARDGGQIEGDLAMYNLVTEFVAAARQKERE